MSTRLHGRTAAADPIYSYRSVSIRVVVAAGDAAGHHSVVEHTLETRQLPMPRFRSAAATTLLVTEGCLTVEHDGTLSRLAAGDALTLRPGVWQARWNEGDEPARWYEIVAPGGIEAFYREIARIIPEERPADVTRVLEAAARHGLEFDLASLYELVERHQLELA